LLWRINDYVGGQRHREKVCKVEIRILANEYVVIAAFSRTWSGLAEGG
jgi:hypothetical protein